MTDDLHGSAVWLAHDPRKPGSDSVEAEAWQRGHKVLRARVARLEAAIAVALGWSMAEAMERCDHDDTLARDYLVRVKRPLREALHAGQEVRHDD